MQRIILYFCSDSRILCPNHTQELLCIEWDTGLLSPRRVPNVAGRELFWLGLRIVGILQIFYSLAVLQRTVVDFPAFFGDRFDVKRWQFVHIQPVCRRSWRIGGIFFLSGSEHWTLIKNSWSKFKNQKPIVVDVLFNDISLVPYTSNLAGPRKYKKNSLSIKTDKIPCVRG